MKPRVEFTKDDIDSAILAIWDKSERVNIIDSEGLLKVAKWLTSLKSTIKMVDIPKNGMKRTITEMRIKSATTTDPELYVTVVSESTRTKSTDTHCIVLTPLHNDILMGANLTGDINFLIKNKELRPQVYEFIAKEFGYKYWYDWGQETKLQVQKNTWKK